MTSDAPEPSPEKPGVFAFGFSTLDQRPEHQFDAWRSAMEGSIHVSRLKEDGAGIGFGARLDGWDMGGLGLAAMTMPGEGFARHWDHNPRAEADHWSLMIPVADGGGRLYGERPISFGSLGRPFRGGSSDTKVVSLFVPRDLFRDDPGVLDVVSGALGDQGATALLADFVLSLEARLREGSDDVDPERLRDAIAAFLRACLLPSTERSDMAREWLRVGLVERMKAHIRANIESPELGHRYLGARYGISRSVLHRLFEPYGGVAAYIRAERLRAAHRALSRGGKRMSISALAEQLGFADASSFSRAFRQEFGCSPSEVREAGRALAASLAVGRPFDAFLSGLAAG